MLIFSHFGLSLCLSLSLSLRLSLFLGNLNPAQQEYQQSMDILNQYMAEIKLPMHRRMSFRQFFAFNKENFKNRFFIDVLMDKMSPDLQGMLAAYQHGSWIRKIPFFNAKSKEERRVFISKVALSLNACAFSPGELVYHEGDIAFSMFIVQKGLAATKGYVISEGNFFGEDMVLPGARRGSSARALTYLATYELLYSDEEDGKGVVQIIRNYGLKQTGRLIRKKGIQLALKNRFIQILMLVRTRPTYIPMTKKDVEHWKNLNQAKTYLKAHAAKERGDLTEADKMAKRYQEEEAKKVENADNALDFWLKGHVTGADRPDNEVTDLVGGGPKDDLPLCIRKLSKRTERFELNMQRAKSMVESGFERIELHLEAQYKVFQDIIRKAERQEKKLSSTSKKK